MKCREKKKERNLMKVDEEKFVKLVLSLAKW